MPRGNLVGSKGQKRGRAVKLSHGEAGRTSGIEPQRAGTPCGNQKIRPSGGAELAKTRKDRVGQSVNGQDQRRFAARCKDHRPAGRKLGKSTLNCDLVGFAEQVRLRTPGHVIPLTGACDNRLIHRDGASYNNAAGRILFPYGKVFTPCVCSHATAKYHDTRKPGSIIGLRRGGSTPFSWRRSSGKAARMEPLAGDTGNISSDAICVAAAMGRAVWRVAQRVRSMPLFGSGKAGNPPTAAFPRRAVTPTTSMAKRGSIISTGCGHWS